MVTRHSNSGEEVNLRRQMTEHVLQDAAVLVIVQLIRRIDTADQRHALKPAVRRNDLREQTLMRFQVAVQAANGDKLVTLEAERLPRGVLLEHQRDDAHADKVGTVNALERLRDHRAYAEQNRSLRRPVA